MSMFTNVPDYLNWVHETIGIGAKEAGKTFGMSIIVSLGFIVAISIPAVITLTIFHFVRKRQERGQQPGFVQRAQKHSGDPDFLKKARGQGQNGTDHRGKGGNTEPEFVRKAREHKGKGGS